MTYPYLNYFLILELESYSFGLEDLSRSFSVTFDNRNITSQEDGLLYTTTFRSETTYWPVRFVRRLFLWNLHRWQRLGSVKVYEKERVVTWYEEKSETPDRGFRQIIRNIVYGFR